MRKCEKNPQYSANVGHTGSGADSDKSDSIAFNQFNKLNYTIRMQNNQNGTLPKKKIKREPANANSGKFISINLLLLKIRACQLNKNQN